MTAYIFACLYPDPGGLPFVSIRRNNAYKCYNLTRASSRRLARAVRRRKGILSIDGQGWYWYRQA